MKYLSVKNETGVAIEKAEIITDHSIAESPKVIGNEVMLHFFAKRSARNGDGLELILQGEVTPLKICWDYEDRADYYPIPIESDGKWVIVRQEGPQQYCFLIVSREKANEMAKTLLHRGETCGAVQKQIGLKQTDILQMQTGSLKN